MSDQTQEAHHTSAAGGKTGAKPLTPTMNDGEHTTFLDLLLQQVAEASVGARGDTSSKTLLRVAGDVVTKAGEAIREFSIPSTGTAFKRLFRSMDAAFMGLSDLHEALLDSGDPALTTSAEAIRIVMTSAEEKFNNAGWKSPPTAAIGHARAKAGAGAGLADVSMSEKGSLGRLHLRAARQHILGSWQTIVDGEVDSVAKIAAQNMREGMAILIDPNLAGESASIRAELEFTNAVLGRLFLQLTTKTGSMSPAMLDLAQASDSLLAMFGMNAPWTAKASPVSAPVAKATAPDATQGAGATQGASGKDAPPPPSADPAMHRIVETKTYARKVHVMDTNYTDEYLGYIELFMVVNRTASGQVYVQRANARPHLDGRANEYLSVGADVAAYSLRENQSLFTDVYFDVDIATQDRVRTTTSAISAKLSAKDGDATGEVGAGVTFSTATKSRGSRTVRRVFRIAGGPTQKQMAWDPMTFEMKEIETGLAITERKELHEDFKDWELDDDDVGDDWDSLYANWVLHSYDD